MVPQDANGQDPDLRDRLERADVPFCEGAAVSLHISSCDPDDGCPDVMVLAGVSGTPRIVIERASMRPLDGQEHDLAFEVVDQAATLCDRAEHAVGMPVSLQLGHGTRGLGVVRAERVSPTPAFLPSPYRLVSLLSREEGPIAPLAVDALALGLERDEEGGVIRAFARAYRRVTDSKPTSDAPRPSLVAFTRRAAEVALDATEPLGEARALRASIVQRCIELDAIDVTRLPASSLGRALRARRELVAEAHGWLDRARGSTGAALDVLRGTITEVPDEVVDALVAVRATEDRRRREAEIARLGHEASAMDGTLLSTGRWPDCMIEHAEQVRARATDLRPLGLDVRPLAYGASLGTLAEAAARLLRAEDDEARRARAHEAVIALGPRGVLSPARQGLLRGLLSLFDRLASAKGEIADALALALLRLRRCAVEAGARLVDEGVLELADDALYLSVAEIEEALRGEAGAFASRVRARREEDVRFRELRAPRRLAARSW
jgi:hypothetical protein